MDKELGEILDDIEQFFLTTRASEREYRRLSQGERKLLPQPVHDFFDAVAG